MSRRLRIEGKTAVMVMAALLLGACATVQTDGTEQASDLQTAVQRLAEFTHADLQAAKADADAHGDVMGSMCWAAIDKHVGAGTVGSIPEIKGVFSAFQAKRDLQRSLGGLKDSPVLQDIKIGCAPMLMDERILLVRLGILGPK
jgi:hypothetical protein